MAELNDPGARELLENPNYADISTHAKGRKWPSNLDRDPRTTLVVQEAGNPYHFLQIRGRVTRTAEGAEADDHINALAKKYTGQDEYPSRQPGEQRVKYVITPDRVRYVKQ